VTYDKSHQSTLNYHATMLHDAARVDAYARAISQVVKPGDVVVDLGCGTGILSLLACQAGASRVFAIEQGPVIELARRSADLNGFRDRITFLQGLSTEITVPEPGDVLVTETIGNMGLDEGILGFVDDARTRLLKPGAKVLPGELELLLAPVTSELLYQPVVAWRTPTAGLDFSPGAQFSANNVHWVKLNEGMLRAPPQQVCEVSVAHGNKRVLSGSVVFDIQEPGDIHGLGGWFAAEIVDGIRISNGLPFAWSSWANAFFPFSQPAKANAGDRLRVDLSIGANGALWTWRWALDRSPPDAGCAVAGFTLQSSFLGSYGKPGAIAGSR
jgi:hypothetical protein